MNRIALCIAVLLLASGAWGQQKKPKLSTYHVEIVWQGQPLCCVTVQEPEHRILGVDATRTFALEDATSATVWTDAEWKSCEPCMKYDAPAKQEKKAPPVALKDSQLWFCENWRCRIVDIPPITINDCPRINGQCMKEVTGDECNHLKADEVCSWIDWLDALKADAAGILCNDAYDAPPCPNDAIKNWVTSRAAVAQPPKKSAWVSPRKTDDIYFTVLPSAWVTGTGNVVQPPPFDVPPKEMDSMISGQKIRSYFCTNKKRVLLMSEDKKWHCYFFAELRDQP